MLTNSLILVGVIAIFGVIIYAILRTGDKRGQSKKSPDARPVASTRPNQRRNWLVGSCDPIQGRAWHIGSRTATLGRGVSNFVQITDKDVSRVHCQFIPSPVGLQVKDMDSGNGFLVNGERVNGIHTLKDGDTLKVGNMSFVFHEVGDFEDYALQAGKAVGVTVSRPTMLSGVQTVGEMVRSALEAHSGDVEAAAESVGMDIEKFQWLCQSQNINPEDYR